MPDKNVTGKAQAQLRQSGGVCISCGKPISKARRGSFTAWIFLSQWCRCKNSTPNRPVRQFRADVASRLSSGGHPKYSLPDLGEKYEVLALIGHGGMGSVYRARDKSLNKTVAVKILREELA